MPIAPVVERKVVHVLEDEVTPTKPKMDLVTINPIIAGMPVTFEEVSINAVSEEDFIITDAVKIEEKTELAPQQFQTDLMFDLPLSSNTEVKSEEEIRFNLNIDKELNIHEIEVFEATEVKVEKREVEKRYILEDFDAQPTIGKSSRFIDKKVVEEETIQFELKTARPQSEINNIEAISEEVSPLDLTIAELQKRAEERRKKMKGFNYKFNDQLNKNIDEIERQPAYKRLGIDLDKNTAISKSETSLKKDNDDLGYKSNNSFLHDNVD
jgi:cell division protein FtsZ